MGTTRISPLIRECDFLRGTLLEEQFLCDWVEKEDGERAMEKTVVDVGH
jgi:hypothetical protein